MISQFQKKVEYYNKITNMNKLCVTKQGITFLQKSKNINEQDNKEYCTQIKRRSSLPQLISSANLSQKQQINKKLSLMSMKIQGLKDKGLKRMRLQKQDKDLQQILEKQYTDRKQYLKNKVPDLIKRTKDGSGNLNSRIQRGRAYLERLENNFDSKFIFQPPSRLQKD